MILTPAPISAELPLDPDFDEEIDADEVAFVAPGGIDLSPITLHLDDTACGQRLDKVVATLVPQFSRSRLQLWFDGGHILVDGKTARGKDT
ncbi:MAG: S4 domain-containing protein, partial [Telluria sp.]